jgi:hypothetical protein
MLVSSFCRWITDYPDGAIAALLCCTTCQLVGEQFLASCAVRRILSGRKYHVPPHRVRPRIHGFGRRRRSGITMDSHVAEIEAPRRLKSPRFAARDILGYPVGVLLETIARWANC